MFCVFWCEPLYDEYRPKCEVFECCTMALQWAESLRKQGYRFVTIASEIPGNVTKMGVDVTDESYDWKKRRI